MVNSWLFVIKIYKLMFIMIPLNLFIIPSLIYRYRPQDFVYMTIVLILMYLSLCEDFIFKKKLLKEINQIEICELKSMP